MHISFVLGCSLLCACAVLANPVDLPPETLLPRVTQLDNDASYKAGAILSKDNNAIQYVTSSFVVPSFSGDPGSGVAFWVGIDGVQCGVSLRTGVTFIVNDDESSSYYAWYQWYPGVMNTYNMTTMRIGDTISLAVRADSMKSGSAVIVNQDSGDSHTGSLTSNVWLCQRDAQWIVSAIYYNQGFFPVANFSQVTFEDAEAAGAGGTYTPANGATVVNIEQNGQTITSTSIEGSSVVVSYV